MKLENLKTYFNDTEFQSALVSIIGELTFIDEYGRTISTISDFDVNLLDNLNELEILSFLHTNFEEVTFLDDTLYDNLDIAKELLTKKGFTDIKIKDDIDIAKNHTLFLDASEPFLIGSKGDFDFKVGSDNFDTSIVILDENGILVKEHITKDGDSLFEGSETIKNDFDILNLKNNKKAQFREESNIRLQIFDNKKDEYLEDVLLLANSISEFTDSIYLFTDAIVSYVNDAIKENEDMEELER